MKKAIFFVLIIMLAGVVEAKGITFTLDSNEYYFNLGQEAVVTVHSDSGYKFKMDGLLSYTIMQTINQQGFHYSSTNTNAKTFSVMPGKTNLTFNFGASDKPTELDVSMSFKYDDKEVSLDGIKIFFVQNNNNKNANQQQVKSTSKQVQRPQQPKQPTTSQKLQNNQVAQDSSALKQQMQKQMQEQQKKENEFKKNVAANKKVKDANQMLQKKGYNITDAKFNPESANTGSFEIKYQDKNGEQALMRGNMQNGSLTSMQTVMNNMSGLFNNDELQKFEKQLNGFKQKNASLTYENNKTKLRINYMNDKNQTATITADVVNNTIKNPMIQQNKENKNHLIYLLLLLIPFIYLFYKKFYKKPVKTEETKVVREKKVDHKKVALEMLGTAKRLFDDEKYKDAYSKAAQALRFYLSYEHGLKKEITNNEILRYLKKHKIKYKKVKHCFDLCALVTFAKYTPNSKDFNMIVKIVNEIIKNGN
ncbi:hypothetical protein D6777_03215 [Candidatus Woesearchaeota archaeon]|nr:MAG: hypothetical protein D6777_03215 [Candidatus Woesearchaeota archaeon]